MTDRRLIKLKKDWQTYNLQRETLEGEKRENIMKGSIVSKVRLKS